VRQIVFDHFDQRVTAWREHFEDRHTE
jgi:hypothetical protein